MFLRELTARMEEVCITAPTVIELEVINLIAKLYTSNQNATEKQIHNCRKKLSNALPKVSSHARVQHLIKQVSDYRYQLKLVGLEDC